MKLKWTSLAMAILSSQAGAVELSYSGFGTLGYTQSNQPYTYQRFVNNNGTIKRDSVAGFQVDAQFNPEWGATVQAKLAPALNSDSKWDPSLPWAFIAYRPSNDLLIRVGKQRVPLYLFSESLDVGATYDFAHLPSEMYSIAPTTDYLGASFSKTWSPSLGDLTLDGYTGSVRSFWRFYQRDNVQIPGTSTQLGTHFQGFTMKSTGAVLTLLRNDDRYRASVHKVTATADPGQFFPAYLSQAGAAGIPQLVPLSPFLSGTVYIVPTQAQITKLNSTVFTFGAEINLPKNFRLIGEVNRRKLDGVTYGIDSAGGYLSLLKDVDQWTPYVYYAVLQTKSSVLSLYQAVNGNTGLAVSPLTPPPLVPTVAGAAAGANATQRVLADGLSVYDQNTIALGTSYRLTPLQKIKFEWARTHVGVTSAFVDAPAGSNISNQNIDVVSLSYNIVF